MVETALSNDINNGARETISGGATMRTCLRCNTMMIEDLDVKVDMQGYGIKITKKGVFGDTVKKPKVAVCPQCGEISFYIGDLDKLKG